MIVRRIISGGTHCSGIIRERVLGIGSREELAAVKYTTASLVDACSHEAFYPFREGKLYNMFWNNTIRLNLFLSNHGTDL
ncbi:hypothetical protein NDU88_002710 [Pleurodeles waltl]|uniref:Uncharacterized protein n=1 Tax=Pleurodeles waltl TaxID=8319 RepID=A0AAV7M4Z1_PLEWA|nr:hypothetical protein NDU88_002710 [Pleurodeles waltl]